METVPTTLPERVIHLRDVQKAYHNGREITPVLKQVNLDIDRGEFVFLAGPSGCGKSTLLAILGAMLTPDSGIVRILGQNLVGLDHEARTLFRRQKVGFIFQRFHLIRGLSVIENVCVPMAIRGRSSAPSRRAAGDLLAAVGLAGKEAARTHRLSSGQQQRVAIARALIGDPALILADEPTASLDAKNGQAVVELLRNLVKQQGKTAVVVTHDRRIFPLADRICMLENGRLTSDTCESVATGDHSENLPWV